MTDDADTPPPDPDRADPPASDPLRLAREVADAYRAGREPVAPRRKRRPPPRQARRKGRDDASPLADVMAELVNQQGWTDQLAAQRVFTDWAGVVGPDIAQHSTVEGYADTIVHVRAASTAWKRELQLLAPRIVARLNDELGQGSVTRIEVRGPETPTWRHGKRTVRGGRGPRDTYG